MKKVSFVLAAAAMMLAACQPEEEKIPVVDVTMSSFGFYAETNPEALKADFVVSNPSSQISIVLPYGTPEDALTSLVPSFEVTEGATVTVEETEVESGVTALDFSVPVELLVTVNAKSNAQYTVTVSVAGPASFHLAAVGAEADSLYKSPYMAISPKDGKPYFAAVVDAPTSDQYYPVLYELNDASISKVCTVAEIRADQPTIGFSPEGDLTFAFYNYTGKFVNVYSVRGSAATLMGADNLLYKPLTNSIYPTIGVLPVSSNNQYVAYGVNAASGSLVKRTLNLCKWDGSSWTQENGIPGRDAKNYAYEVFAKLVGKDQYALVFNQNIQSLSLYKFNESGIETIFESLKFNLPLAEGKETANQAKIHLYGLGFDIASDGTPYILAAVESSSTTGSGYSPAIYKYDLESKETTVVGGIFTTLDVQDVKTIAFALDANDIPYVAYKDPATKSLAATYIDSKTKTWSTPLALSASEVENVMMAFSEDGTGYISCAAESEDGNSYINVYSTK